MPNDNFPNRSSAEMQFCRIVVLPKKNFRKSFDRIVTWPKRRISETSWCRTTFFRIVRQPNFPNRRSAELHFYESLFSRTSFSRNIICPNVILPKFYEGENGFRLNDVLRKWRSAKYRFIGNSTIRQYNNSTNWHSTTRSFGKTMICWNDISGIWCGPKTSTGNKQNR